MMIAMETMAKKLSGYMKVLSSYSMDGENWLTVSCQDYEAYSKLPVAVSYQQRIYSKKGWNSDNGNASYGPANNLALSLDK